MSPLDRWELLESTVHVLYMFVLALKVRTKGVKPT